MVAEPENGRFYPPHVAQAHYGSQRERERERAKRGGGGPMEKGGAEREGGRGCSKGGGGEGSYLSVCRV